MEVTKERFEDAGEQDGEGIYDFYYSGFDYTFRIDRERFCARQYDDTPYEIGFTRWERQSGRKWKCQSLDAVPYDNNTFRQAVKYLVDHEKSTRILVLIGEYVSVDLTQLT
jgi:hypothetical protein